ncbi:MAG: serine/threonine-protein kinase [Microbacterium sp.]
MGDVFAGRYELVDPLGSGGSGVVWRAWDRKAERYIAAKVLRQVDASALLRFVREQSMRIPHPHIVAPLSWAGEDDRVLFTMPLLRGGTAATLLGDFGPLPDPWVARIARDVAAALTEIHGLGIVHRDVKPANILLDATGTAEPHAWLSDFGTAVAQDEPRLTRAHLVYGTAGYAAPEALAGADPAPSADLYALGATIAELRSGKRPQHGERPSAPGRFASIVAALTDPDAAARPAAAEALTLLEPLAATPLAGDVEVFDQLPPLPEGWSEAGPATRPLPFEPVPDTATIEAATLEVPEPEAPTQRLEPEPAARPSLVVPLVVIAGGVALIGTALALLL